MSTAHLLSLTAVVIFSFLVSLTSGERTSDHFFNVPKVPQLISMLMYDSNLSGNPNEDRTHLSELLPAASPNFGLSTEENEFDNTLDDFMDDTNGVDDDDDDDAVEVDKVRLGNIVSKVIIQSRRLCSVGLGYVVERTNGYLTRIVLLIGYIVYLVASLIYRFDDEGSHRLLGFTLLGAVIMTRRTTISACRWIFRKVTGIEKPSPRLQGRLETVRYFTRWLMYGGVTGVMAWILIDKAITEPRNLSSVPGLIIIVLVCLMFSTKPDKINYHTVYWGLGLQFIFSLLVLKWEFGKNAIVWLQSRLDEFFENSVVGSKFLFGDDFADHYIMFGALPLLFFTNGVLTLLYYLGAMQLLIKVIGNFLTFVLETSGIESMAVAAGIFMEGVTSLTAFRPYLVTLSKSQMFLVITSCFSSIGGAYLAVLSKMGVSVEFIIGAMLVSAPATFTVCKLMVPETKDLTKGGRDEAVSKIGDEEKGKYSNGLDAMQTGALNMLSVVGNIAVSAFTLICFIEWINQTLIWFGDRIGENGLSMEFIASYILFPISVAMGVELQDCRRVAMLNGYRVASSNIVAFFKLTEMRENRMIFEDYMLKTNGTGNVTYVNDDIILNDWSKTLHLGFISLRSEAITTYFLCGFSSFLSVAIHLGMMSAYVPNRKKWLTKMAPAAFVAGNLANIMTGCFACIFY
uniref:Concentrative nucleoside transporter C-terminal domain-containing protein n=1 Tax=Arion vulgaris TaxID=1028688 RepID=A0A0B7BBS2_9EUPU